MTTTSVSHYSMNIRTSILMKSSRNGGLSQGITFLCHLNFHLNLALKEGTKMKVSVVIALQEPKMYAKQHPIRLIVWRGYVRGHTALGMQSRLVDNDPYVN